MIKNASELLESFVAAERTKASKFDMPHMPTLGTAYEAIAKAGIESEFVLPPNLDLRVVSGFIVGIPNQIDGMLVKGEGQRYGLTEQFFYPIEQVLCVLEIKKTLKKKDLIDGIGHLAAVQKHFIESFISRFDKETFDLTLASESYEKITGRTGPCSAAALDALPDEDRLLYVTLARQIYAPVTVLLGFDGYATEEGLREAMLDIIESNCGADSVASPELLPSLITSGEFSLVKCTGCPYLAFRERGKWLLLVSARQNSARTLLEFLWSKISVFCKVRMPFGTDMDYENLKELLFARGASKEGQNGFIFESFSYSEKQLKRSPVLAWEPIKLSVAAVDLASSLVFRGGFLELEQSMVDYIEKKYCVKFEDIVRELIDTCAVSIQANILQKIANQLLIATLDDGTGYIDLDGPRLKAWCDGKGLNPSYMNAINMSL
ncbi:DUF6602 domain-containing protein [Iodobacter ciconiae]|uniref:DUF6602 domain-containing protein n=1 Tax=Iodobacter ciconiae TaxID=2496266 RepID=A0A3S8ZS86_9NEIS|nr:DUF6602 domain-containing protein [Iodobacter ciconiae]AZN36285.1 hypothetical protein EJO50_07165 [Iodobacter ciconiae]